MGKKPYRGGPKTVLKEPKAARRLLELISEKNPKVRHELRRFIQVPAEKKRAAKTRRLIDEMVAKLPETAQERLYAAGRRALRDPNCGRVFSVRGGHGARSAGWGWRRRRESSSVRSPTSEK